jgi:hypothetical protein
MIVRKVTAEKKNNHKKNKEKVKKEYLNGIEK